MSFEKLTGPQRVSNAAHRITECPHLAGSVNLVSEMALVDDAYEAERLHKFGLVKVISDEVADRLPNMTEAYPPYGLPEIYRSSDMPSPGWRPLRELKPIRNSHEYNPIQSKVGSLRGAYGSKIIVHTHNVLESMEEDPEFHNALSAVAVHASSEFFQPRPAVEMAYNLIGRPASDNSDVMFGLMAVVSKVLEQERGEAPTHDETIAVLKKSRRLPILPSLLSRSQLGPFLIATTRHNKAQIAPWGFDFDPANFATFTDKVDGVVGIDFQGGIGGLNVPSYKLDRGEFGDAYSPTVIVDNSAPSTSLDEKEVHRTALTCPSRRLIAAIWKDMIDIADEVRIFDTDEMPVPLPLGRES